jgi:glutamate-1-semialdehyde aminotransferase/predicted aldo/keto reductase-like oxidoreductase
MEYRRLGKSELVVSAVGFGTCQLRLLSEREAIDTLLTGFERGVNLVHTGPDYGPAEDYVAKAVARADRPVIVASHGADVPSNGSGPVRHFEAQFEAACARLGTERLDLFGIACIDDREAFKENVWGRNGMVAFLQRKKQEGRLRGTFCTTHGAPDYVSRLVTSGAFDAVMLAYNVLGYHLLSCYPTPGRHVESLERNKREIFPLCRQHGVGLMIMKPLGGGLLCDSRAFPPRREGRDAVKHTRARDLLRSILQHPEVTCVVPGTNSVEEAAENAQSGDGPFTPGDEAHDRLDAVVSELRRTVCSRCGECEPSCSQRLSISWMFRAALINLYPSAQHEVLEHVDYFRLHPALEATCASCTNRTCACPSGIDIPNALTDVHRQMVGLMNRRLIPGPMAGEPRVRVPRAATAAQAGPGGAARSTLEEWTAERQMLQANLDAKQQLLLMTTDRLRRLEHTVGAIRTSRAYKVLRRLGRWGAVEDSLASLAKRGAATHASRAFEDAAPGAPSRRACPPPPAELYDWDLNPVVHPLDASHGYAGHLVDLQGRDFIDLSCGWGANILGYGYPRVADAVAVQARRFAGVGMPYPGFRELEQLLCGVIPGAEHVRFGKNGSDATMGAVRLARAITGRERVLHRGYHGFHDWWMASTDCQGIPGVLRELIAPLPAFTAEAVDEAFRRHPGEIACVILDPMSPPMPTGDVVRDVMEVTHRHGALMIFDEVVSGFRVAPGGMQEIWGLQPDLACYGKAVANGLPLSVLSGKHQHMRRLPDVRYGMTFEGEAISIAAALVTVREIVDKNVCEALAEKGRLLVRAYARLARQYGVATSLAGPLARPHLTFEAQNSVRERELRWLCIQELARAGVLTVGTFNLCYTHDDDDLNAVTAAFDGAMPVLRRALDERSVTGLLDGRILQGLGVDRSGQ